MNDLHAALGASWMSDDLLSDFHALCDCGGRLAGTESEFAAREVLAERLDKLGGRRDDFTFDYTGWLPDAAAVVLNGSRELDAVALPGSPPLARRDLPVVDVGLGTERDFASAADLIKGAAVLVRHEYPFTTGHTHRRYKYQWAVEHGASAFMIANPIRDGGPVTGGSGVGSADDIPAVGLSWAAGQAIADAAALGSCRVNLEVDTHESTWSAQNLILDLPGQTDEWVLLCAHIDGHEAAESAMDNATGLAAVLEAGRRLGPLAGSFKRGIRLAMFTVEEWGLDGSARYVDQMPQDAREKLALAVALDSITGHPRLSALVGGGSEATTQVMTYARAAGLPIDVVRPLLANSDHYNFQRAGIPSARLIAGYGHEDSLTRYLLTPADTREFVDPGQLKAATMSVIALIHAACN